MLLEDSVRERYSEDARERQEALCCPVDYDRELLKLLPKEIIDKGIEPKMLAEPLAWCAPPGTRRPPTETKGGRQIAECGGEKCC